MAKQNASALKLIAESAMRHQICNHSWSHPNFKKLADAKFKEEIEDTQKEIEDTTSMCMLRILRPPYGAITAGQRQIAKDMGYRLEGWTVDPLDWKNRDAKKVSKAILDSAKDGSVVLSHDIYASTVEAMKTVVPALLAKYTLGTISQLNLFTTQALG